MVDDFNSSIGNGVLADFIPVFKYIPTPGIRNIRKGFDLALEMMQNFMKEHRENFDPGVNADS